MIDSEEGVTGLDQRIAEDVVEAGRACVVVLNKWDVVTRDETDRVRLDRAITSRLRFLDWARTQRTSATTGRGVGDLLPALVAAVESHRRRIPTAEVNRIVADAQQRRAPARSAGRANRILYAVQADVAPPRFLLFASHRLDPAYIRFVEHQIRAVEPFEGSPLEIEVRRRSRRQVES